MRIQFQREGGFAAFPGLSKPITIDTDALSPSEAATLDRLVSAARFFNQPTELGKPSPEAADYYQYTITIDTGGRQHTVRLTEPVDDPDLQALVNALQARAAAIRTGARKPPLG